MTQNHEAGLVERPVQIVARTLDPEAFETDQDSAYVSISVRRRRIATDLAKHILTALGETHVLVNKEAIRQARLMANICFNLKQTSALDTSTRKSLAECQTAFDNAMRPAAAQNNGG